MNQRTLLTAVTSSGLLLALSACGSSSHSHDTTLPSLSSTTSSSPTSHTSPTSAPSASASIAAGASAAAGDKASGTTSGAPVAATISQQSATSSLQNAAKTDLVSAVQVGSGYEGASATANTITFWKMDAQGTWHQDGSYSRIPPVVPQAPQKLRGARLPGASHAMYILDAPVSGDGNGPKDQAFAKDAHGWGGIVEASNGDISITHASTGPGELFAADFHNGHFQVSDYYTSSDEAHSIGIPTDWKVSGSTFTRVTSTSTTGSTYRVPSNDWALFNSPSGKNGCFFQSGAVGCSVNPSAKGSGGHGAVQLTASGPSLLNADMPIAEGPNQGDSWATSTPGLKPPPANDYVHQLPYGDSITDGSITCKSSTNGFTCSNSHGGFSVNSQSVSLHH